MRYELSRTASGWVVGRDSEYRRIAGGLDDVLTEHDPVAHVAGLFGTGEPAGDSTWSVPEPEFTLVISAINPVG